MSIQVMDTSENEGRGKIKGRAQEVTKEKSILGFFKSPPEKEALVKQKSLLQFFVKANIAPGKNKTYTNSIKCDKENLAQKTDKDERNKDSHIEMVGTEAAIDTRLSEDALCGNNLDDPITVSGDSSDCSLICLENDVKDERKEKIEKIVEDPVSHTKYCVESSTAVEGIQRLNGEYEDSDAKITLAKDEVHTISVEDKDSCSMLTSNENLACSAQKRSNLKVKDMLNLLKEVKVSEKKEKRKKHKQKLHKQKTTDTWEINVEPNDVTVCEGADKDLKEHGYEVVNNEIESCQVNKLYKDDSIWRKKQKDDQEKEKEDSQKNLDNTASKLLNMNENPREMSYSEFLDRLNKKERMTEVDKGGETEDLDSLGNNVKSVKDESDNVITKYFNCTSTPGREKLMKKVNIDGVQHSLANSSIKAETLGQTEVSITCKSGQNNSKLEGKLVTENFLQSKIDVSSKTTSQAMLCFGSDGFKIARQKGLVDSTTDQKVKSAKGRKDKEQISDNIHNNAAKNLDLNTSESAFETPVKRKNMKRKYCQNGDLDELEMSGLTDQPESEGCRRSQRKKYKVTVFQMDEERKTPIKIKLRRCAKSSSSGNEFDKSAEGKVSKRVQTKGKVKQTTAQALLEKAKNRIHKTKLRTKSENRPIQPNETGRKLVKSVNTKQELNDTKKKNKKKKEAVKKVEHTNARRSSRLEGKVKVSMEEVSLDNIVISSDEEAEGISKWAKKQKKKAELGNGVQPSKSTPVKSSKTKSPVKRSSAKLAPMFLIGKKKAAASPAKPVLDQEQARQRQLFLMSGVPDELKKQTSIRHANLTVSSYPPFPTVNHVQQICKESSNESGDKRLNVWKVEHISLDLLDYDLQSAVTPFSKFSSTDIFRENEKGTNWNWKFEKPAALEDNIAEKCLGEIIASNPAYPIKEMFRAFREFKLHSENEQIETDAVEFKTDMKGILFENMEKSEAEQKKKPERSLKLSKVEDRKNRDEAKTAVADSQTSSSLLWTDKYYPTKASEILGNGGGLKKLKDWLLEWKQVLDREARKARKLLLKKNKGKMAASKGPVRNDDSDFDSDFDMDSDDSEDDMSLCNTTLLVGPHGCGKTSSVYALAQELGFKVHEVNASSSRSGRHILSQLQEATQSHQVSSQGCHTPSKKKGILGYEKVSNNKEQPRSKMALPFTNLLSKQKSNKDKVDSAQKKKRQKGDKGDVKVLKETGPTGVRNKQMTTLISEDSNSQSLSHSINLSRTTLILFEEVDVTFEEDKGFLAAVQTFMSTTKIPIILTSNKKNFSPNFDGRFEVINLKRPSVEAITSHLQTIALVENIRTNFAKLSELVSLYNRDVRQCLLTLQLLVESGGSTDQYYSVLMDAPMTKKTSDKMSDINADKASEPQTRNEGKADDDDLDDFVVLKGRQTKRRRILDDQDSNSGDHYSCPPVHQTSVVAGQGQDARNYPVVYGFGLKCFLPGLLLCESSSTVEYIKENLQDRSRSKVEDLIAACRTFRNITGINLYYSNMHLLLPLSFSVCDSIRHISQGQRRLDRKTKKRKRIQSDLYDSEGSGGEEVSTCKDDELVCTVKEHSDVETPSKTNNSCLMKSLTSFASFYDTMSSLDVISTSSGIENHDRIYIKGDMKVQTRLPAGLEDELCNFSNISNFGCETLYDIQSTIETRAFCKLSQHLECVRDELEKSEDITSDQWGKFIIPVITGMDQFQVKDKSSTSIELQRAVTDVRDNLPYTLYKNHRCVSVDYTPTLREICRCESARLSANTKRRFQHYLDNITLPLKDKTVTILATTFT